MQKWLTGIVLALVILPAGARELPLNQISLPAGFHISLYSGEVPNARSMSISPSGTLFVGSRHAGKVYAVLDRDQDGQADKVYVIASGLNSPNGVAFYNGALYVAEINRILRFDDIEYHLHRPPTPIVISTDFPADTHHGWKFIRIGPDNKLYVPIGAPCNVCIEYGYAVITRLNLDGTQHENYASGVRNTVGFDWHPDTKDLWFTDNGRDMLGDDLPPDELNRASDEGQHFGFPYCHGGEVIDPEFGLGHSCSEYVPPVQKLGAYVAALGMRFYTGKMFPNEYHKQVFIAEHGSRNRSTKTGYRISMVRLKGNKAVSYESFAQGWLQGQQAWGRPVDIEQMPDGSLLISDDKAGAIYRIYYDENKLASPVVIPATQTSFQSKPMQEHKTEQTIRQPQIQQRVQPEIQAPSQQQPPKQKTVTAVNKQSKSPEPPKGIHERLIQDKNNQQVETIENEISEPPESGAVETQVYKENGPPAELIEKIRKRAEQEKSDSVDPFAPVKKQVIDQ